MIVAKVITWRKLIAICKHRGWDGYDERNWCMKDPYQGKCTREKCPIWKRLKEDPK